MPDIISHPNGVRIVCAGNLSDRWSSIWTRNRSPYPQAIQCGFELRENSAFRRARKISLGVGCWVEFTDTEVQRILSPEPLDAIVPRPRGAGTLQWNARLVPTTTLGQ